MNHIRGAEAGDLYRLMVQSLASMVVLADDTLHILSADGGHSHLLADMQNPVLGLAFADVIPARDYDRFEIACRAALLGRPQEFEVEVRGHVYRASASPISSPAAPNAALLISLVDISKYKSDTRALERVDHAYRTLSAGNRAVMRAKSEDELLALICQVSVETGGYVMSWVGLAERDEDKTLVPVAWAGREEGYLTAQRLTWADSDMGQRPGSQSVRSGTPVIVQNIATDPAFDKWRDEAIARGYASALSAPLLDDNHKAFGCLAFYSEEPAAFDSREAQLLVDLAGGLAYGIRTLRNDQMRVTLVTSLQESESRFRMISEVALAGIYLIQDNQYAYINPAMAGIFGFTRKEMASVGSIVDLVHPDDRHIVDENIRRRVAGEVDTINYEVRCIRKDGSIIYVEALGSRVEFQGKPAVLGMVLDITTRVRAEQAEREQRRLAEALAATAASLINALDAAAVLRNVVDGLLQVVSPDMIVIMSGRDNLISEVLAQTPATVTTATVQPVRIQCAEVPVLSEMARTCEMVVTPDGSIDTGWMEQEGFDTARSLVGVPICVDKKVLGFVLLLSATPGTFTEAHGRTIRAFADQAATALKNVDLYRQLNTYNDYLEDAIESATVEMRRVKEQMEGIVVNDPKAVLLLAADGSIKLSNPAFERLFEYETSELRGQPLNMVIAPRDTPTLDGALQALTVQHVTMHLDLHALRKSGEEFEVQVALAPIEDSERLLGIVCDVHDVSTFKEVERLKDAFVSNVSHELRTPITSLRLNAALMRKNPEKSDVYLDRQLRDLDRLGKLIEDLLQLSRLDQNRGEITFRPLDIGAWAASLIDDYTILASQNDQKLSLETAPGLPPVEADSGFLSQVLGNLLNNAINYTPPGGTIHVTTLTRTTEGTAWVGFTVHDSGPGISQEDQERLFERFFRGRVGRAARAPGTGLGLPIAREIVSLHHGQIEVESTGIEGEGAMFRVWLPAIKAKGR